MVYKVSKKGMKKGYWKIVDNKGTTINSGITSKASAITLAKKLNKRK